MTMSLLSILVVTLVTRFPYISGVGTGYPPDDYRFPGWAHKKQHILPQCGLGDWGNPAGHRSQTHTVLLWSGWVYEVSHTAWERVYSAILEYIDNTKAHSIKYTYVALYMFRFSWKTGVHTHSQCRGYRLWLWGFTPISCDWWDRRISWQACVSRDLDIIPVLIERDRNTLFQRNIDRLIMAPVYLLIS